MTTASYVFDNAWTEERRRLALLEAGWDPVTIAHLDAIGVTDGWRCLEVGAGGGSIAAWLCGRVGTRGSVVATDLDPRFLSALGNTDLEVRAHDIVKDELERDAFDLVHTRLLLEHLPERDLALDRMISALKPGGWLLVEEFDHVTFAPDPGSQPEFLQAWAGFAAAFDNLSRQRGLALAYGSRLPGEIKRRGLTDVSTAGRTQTQSGGSPLSEVLALSALKMQEPLIATGEVDLSTLEQFVSYLRDPRSQWMTQLMVSAWGRRPS
jgi:SAM-dependent methyltransferase